MADYTTRRVQPRGLRTHAHGDTEAFLNRPVSQVGYTRTHTKAELRDLRKQMARAYLKLRSVDKARRELGLTYGFGRWLLHTAGVPLEGRGAGAFWYTEHILNEDRYSDQVELTEDERVRLMDKARRLREEGLI